MTSFCELKRAKYVLLTTYRRNGAAVTTPVWTVSTATGEMAVWTDADSRKVERIRRNGRIRVAPCTVRGEATGESVPACARIGDTADVPWVIHKLKRKYGLLGRAIILGSRLSRGRDGGTAVLISPAGESSASR